MNSRLREFEKSSGIELYGLGQDRAKWQASLEQFAQLIVQDCVMFIDTGAAKFSDGEWLRTSVRDIGAMIQEHFGVAE